jgi:hypothetical protein
LLASLVLDQPMRPGSGPWVVGAAWIGVSIVQRHNARCAEYLADCMEHRPRYRCLPPWRRSQPPNNVPIIVPMPMSTR